MPGTAQGVVCGLGGDSWGAWEIGYEIQLCINSVIRGTSQACAALLIPTMHSTSVELASELWQRPLTIDTGFRPWCHCHL